MQVYEQSRLLSEVGAGINISPNASRILIRLGLGEECARVAYRSPFFHQRRWDDGRTLTKARLATDIETRVRRAASHLPSRRTACAAGQGRCRASACIWRTAASASSRTARPVRATFENGVEIEADVLIAADGIFSAVRRALLGPERPRFACRAYRGLIPAEKVRDIPPESTAFLGPGRHFIHYFVSAGRMLNFVGHVEQEDWISESWTEPGKRRRSPRRLRGLASAGAAASSTRWTRPSSGRCSTGRRSRAGPTAASPCWATPAIR